MAKKSKSNEVKHTFKSGDSVRHRINGWVGRINSAINSTTLDVRFLQMNVKSMRVHYENLEPITPMTLDQAKQILLVDLKHKLTTPRTSYDVDVKYIFECNTCRGLVSEVDGFIIGSLFATTCKV